MQSTWTVRRRKYPQRREPKSTGVYYSRFFSYVLSQGFGDFILQDEDFPCLLPTPQDFLICSLKMFLFHVQLVVA